MTDKEIMQMALDALEWCYDVTEWPANGKSAQDKAIEALRARLAQPEPLPAKSKGALSHEENKQHNKKILDKFYEENAHLYTAPPQREWMERERAVGYREGHQAALKQREWQGLTDEEIFKIGNLDVDSNYVGLWYDFARAIEAKLKEKNT